MWRSVAASTCVLFGVLLTGCGKSEPDIRAVADPAMQAAPLAADDGSNTPEVPPEATPEVTAAPATLRYSEAGDRIFVPGIGWLDAGELWDDYRNDPAKLPAGLDVAALHALGPPPNAAEPAAPQ